jgi:hypothetical protein
VQELSQTTHSDALAMKISSKPISKVDPPPAFTEPPPKPIFQMDSTIILSSLGVLAALGAAMGNVFGIVIFGGLIIAGIYWMNQKSLEEANKQYSVRKREANSRIEDSAAKYLSQLSLIGLDLVDQYHRLFESSISHVNPNKISSSISDNADKRAELQSQISRLSDLLSRLEGLHARLP